MECRSLDIVVAAPVFPCRKSMIGSRGPASSRGLMGSVYIRSSQSVNDDFLEDGVLLYPVSSSQTKKCQILHLYSIHNMSANQKLQAKAKAKEPKEQKPNPASQRY
jgi:hypothetical protein